MISAPRKITTPYRRIPLDIPEGMTPIEFFNSARNLKNLAEESGLLRTREDFLLYRKALGHSLTFDCSIIYDTSRNILDPLGRPVRRDQLDIKESRVWSRMTKTVFHYMLEKYPDPKEHLVFCGEASLDPTWPLSKPGVPSIRMIHNHFIVFPTKQLMEAEVADPNNKNLTDSGVHGLFLSGMSDAYFRFFETLDLEILSPIATEASALSMTGYPQGLPSWVVRGGAESMSDPRFWQEYDLILKGFLDFYRTFFALVSTGECWIPDNAYFPKQIEKVLLFDNGFYGAARKLRERCLQEPQIANDIRWRPAFKQLIYRDCDGRLIVTISQNSMGNAITELLGIVVDRVEDEEAYAAAEPALVEQLLDVRRRLVEADLGMPISTPFWPKDEFVPPPMTVAKPSA